MNQQLSVCKQLLKRVWPLSTVCFTEFSNEAVRYKGTKTAHNTLLSPTVELPGNTAVQPVNCEHILATCAIFASKTVTLNSKRGIDRDLMGAVRFVVHKKPTF